MGQLVVAAVAAENGSGGCPDPFDSIRPAEPHAGGSAGHGPLDSGGAGRESVALHLPNPF